MLSSLRLLASQCGSHASVKIVSAYKLFSAYAISSVGEHEHTRIHTHACSTGNFSGPRVHGPGIRCPGAGCEPERTRTLDEIVVTGIRSSLESSMALKRDAQGVVDGIVAEDIGKFPDTNLAESLQRITGVSIDRSIGEGSKITVRGIGPDYNLVLLNGRQMPGSSIGDTFASNSRSFDFANLASEAVSAVEVYKTSRAPTFRPAASAPP